MVKRFLEKIKLATKFWSFWALLMLQMILLVNVLFRAIKGGIQIIDYIWILLIIIISFVELFLIDAIFRVSKIELEKSQVNGMMASMNDAVVSYDEQFKITLVNDAFEKLCGLKENELLDKKIVPEMNSDPKYMILTKIMFPSLAPEMSRLSAETNPSKIQIKIFKPREFILELITTRVENQYDHTFGFVKIIKDRTRENQLMKSKSDFITIVAHQLRTPLTGATWGAEVLYKKELGDINPNQEKILKQTLDTLGDMSKTINDLLKAASIEDGKFGYNFAIGDIMEIINEVLTSLVIRAKEKNIKFVVYPPNFAVPKFVMDKEKIAMAISNIVENAIKYNVVNGEVGIKIEQIKDKPFIKISISDTGIGINEKEFENIFEKFYRSSSVMKTHTAGIGLGLYIVKNIIKNHGGEIWVESIEQRGTTFHFVLPTDQNYIPPQVRTN